MTEIEEFKPTSMSDFGKIAYDAFEWGESWYDAPDVMQEDWVKAADAVIAAFLEYGKADGRRLFDAYVSVHGLTSRWNDIDSEAQDCWNRIALNVGLRKPPEPR